MHVLLTIDWLLQPEKWEHSSWAHGQETGNRGQSFLSRRKQWAFKPESPGCWLRVHTNQSTLQHFWTGAGTLSVLACQYTSFYIDHHWSQEAKEASRGLEGSLVKLNGPGFGFSEDVPTFLRCCVPFFSSFPRGQRILLQLTSQHSQ